MNLSTHDILQIKLDLAYGVDKSDIAKKYNISLKKLESINLQGIYSKPIHCKNTKYNELNADKVPSINNLYTIRLEKEGFKTKEALEMRKIFNTVALCRFDIEDEVISLEKKLNDFPEDLLGRKILFEKKILLAEMTAEVKWWDEQIMIRLGIIKNDI